MQRAVRGTAACGGVRCAARAVRRVPAPLGRTRANHGGNLRLSVAHELCQQHDATQRTPVRLRATRHRAPAAAAARCSSCSIASASQSEELS
eukprot:3586441-Prymnesium_polylepis.1